MSKERPILFSGEMIRAILEGKKTQTRRVIKPQPMGWNPEVFSDGVTWGWCIDGDQDWHEHIRCPYGQPGDTLWVRETWCYVGQVVPEPVEVAYKASIDEEHLPSWKGNWSPSIFMPRWASRITLEVVSVRAERVQDISDPDARAEGVAWDCKYYGGKCNSSRCPTHQRDPLHVGVVRDFQRLWDSINGKREGCSWADNPWVWCVEFKQVTP